MLSGGLASRVVVGAAPAGLPDDWPAVPDEPVCSVEVAEPFAVGPPEPRRALACAVTMATAIAITATTTSVMTRWRGDRSGQPHSRRYTAARPRLVLMGMTPCS